ncbi:MAG: EamA family transporter [Armatimonadota bacterium]|nr:EamA family transporter [Armatimonadota bacterium]MDR7421223.1 EamA family transporter [Armatimonadota bacterium]MDR7452988.1 EamA family transporter [Armatimonadota bacterium]MDR7457546.1 EamA family transporter [Armatimonadota bacterium]MDR7496183.1 EamA family transporter [Armatimonadota bacterium]
MSGVLWAVASGVGFGLFQVFNRRAVRDLDVYVSTFLQLVVSVLVLGAVVVASGELALLRGTGAGPIIEFGIAAFLHFFLGWTLLNASQKQTGAARTTLLVATVPVFGTIAAAVGLGEFPGWPVAAGVGLTVTGVILVSGQHPGIEGAGRPARWWEIGLGLGAALCWAVSPVFARRGLEGLPSPLLGLTLGLAGTVVAYGMLLAARRGAGVDRALQQPEALGYKLLAGVLVALSQWARWVAIDLAPVAVVLALIQAVVPAVVLALAPLVLGRHLERVTGRLWLGAGVITSGSLLLIFRP